MIKLISRSFIIYIFQFFLSIFFFNSISVAAIKNKDLTQIENYINKIKTFRARFVQLGPEQESKRSGVIMFAKPGHIKLYYNKPKELTFISNNGKALYYDHEMQELTKMEQDHPLSKLLTTEAISLEKFFKIISITDNNNHLELLLSKDEKELEKRYPYIALNFEKKPRFRINKITIVNDEITLTELLLSDSVENIDIDKKEFQFKDPKFFELRD
jgi:outer membrane lipoprotein-sorting protein